MLKSQMSMMVLPEKETKEGRKVVLTQDTLHALMLADAKKHTKRKHPQSTKKIKEIASQGGKESGRVKKRKGGG